MSLTQTREKLPRILGRLNPYLFFRVPYLLPILSFQIYPVSFYVKSGSLELSYNDIVSLATLTLSLISIAFLASKLYHFCNFKVSRKAYLALCISLSLYLIFNNYLYSHNRFVLNGSDIFKQLTRQQIILDYLLLGFSLFVLVFFTRAAKLQFTNRIFKILLLYIVFFSAYNFSSPAFSHSKQKNSNQVVEQVFSFSPENNKIVVILDSFPASIFSEILETYPNEVQFLEGFNFYPNTLGVYPTTNGAITTLSTGKFNLNTSPLETFRKSTKNISDHMKSKNYKLDSVILPISGNVYGLSDADMRNSKRLISSAPTLKNSLMQFLDLSLFATSPNSFKSSIYRNGNWFVQSWFDGLSMHEIDEYVVTQFEKESTIVDSQENVFHLYHLYGAHLPFVEPKALELANLNPSYDQALDHGRLALFQLKRIFERLKDLKIYDSAQIIVASDHGYSFYRPFRDYGSTSLPQTVLSSARPLLMFKQNSTGPLQISNDSLSLIDLPCLISGGDFSGNCEKLDSGVFRSRRIYENRKFFHYDWVSENWANQFLPKLTEYFVVGDVRNLDNWYVNDAKDFRSTSLTPLEFDKTYFFKDASILDAFNLLGFSQQEDWGRWATGSSSSIEFKLSGTSAGKNIYLDFDFFPLLSDGLTEYTDVYINGKFYNKVDVRKQTRIMLTQEELQPELNKITFENPNSISPVSLSVKDSRLLSIGFRSFRVSRN